MRRHALKGTSTKNSLDRRHQRRHEWYSQLRKVRKSHQIQLKRTTVTKITTSSSSISMTDTAEPQATSSVVELCQLYVHQQQQLSSTIVIGTTLATSQSRLSKHVNHQQQQHQQPHEEVNTCGTLDSLLLRHSSNSTPPATVSLL